MEYITLEIYLKDLLDTCDEMLEFIDYARTHPNAVSAPNPPTLQKIDQWAKVIEQKKQSSKSSIVEVD